MPHALLPRCEGVDLINRFNYILVVTCVISTTK
jgi:hypothetical protein